MCILIQCAELPRVFQCDIQYDFIKKVTIAYCNNSGLTTIPQNIPSHINVLDLSSNDLSKIDTNAFGNFSDLQVLNLTNNKLNSLSNKTFQGLSKLSVLNMSHNMLDLSQDYSAELFLPIQNLTALDISYNMNQSDNGTGYNYPDHAISVLRELSFLAIDMMPLSQFGSGFSRLNNLKELHFQSCYLKRLENKTFQRFSSSVEVLTLRNCLLYFVTTEIDALLPFPNLRVIDFFGTFMHLKPALQLLNPYRYANITTINFGRVSYPMRDFIDLPFSLTITSDIIKHLKTICVENLDLSENGIVDYELGSLFSFDHPKCLRHLSFKGNSSLKNIVLKNAHINNGIRKYGDRFFKDLASVVSLDISQNDIWYFTDELLKPMTNLTYLYLSQNLLPSVPIQLTGHSYINTLDVRNNLLTRVSSDNTRWADWMQELHGMTLNIHGNAFECSCDTIDFIRLIQTTKVNLDSRSYICKISNGTVIDTLIAYNSLYDLFADCKSTLWLTLASSLLSTFVTISLLLVVYSKRWQILFSIYGIIRRTVEREVRKSYQYDVYVSYEGEVVVWIKDVLIPKLEDEWGLAMCIKDRDFLSGTSLADIEAASIEKSRCIIFVITPEFKSSHDCLFELDRAKYEKL
ncbi:unnamed protein product [Mytilus edulis]|uniref:TIR domain-containing protein n=1 Tax=Mytilus edulis TaxID=6550 RepID=A0A8S3QK46_MYTED|nr:unnamed protein product [Mytilus edulis]